MVHVVFELDLDDETVESLQELRWRRRDVLKEQLAKISQTLDDLEAQGVIRKDERTSYAPQVKQAIESKLATLEWRIKDAKTIYNDELELYFELMRSVSADKSQP